MSAQERRRKLLHKLEKSKEPITGSSLADYFSVSRQVIVQDIALLRAQGEEIQATSQGYVIPEVKGKMVERTIACTHNGEEIEAELATIIKYGGRVRDVIVEHPLYGELKGLLRIQSRADLDEFLKQYEKNNVKPLLTLTGGIHLHTIEALNQEVLDLIEEKLRAQGFLLE